MQCPSMADGLKMHPGTFALVNSDRWAQRSLYEWSKLLAKCCNGFGPPVTEVDWYWLAARMADELRSMSEVLKKANLGVKQHGGTASIL